MPAVYAIISFLSYRYFRDYTYYQLIEIGKSSRAVYLIRSLPLTKFRLSLRGNTTTTNPGKPTDH